MLWGSVQCQNEKGWFTLYASTEHWEVEFWKSGKSAILWDSQESVIFSNLQYSTSKCFKLACKVNQLSRLGAVRICVMPRRKRLIHFACQLGALRSKILKIWKKCQNCDILRNLALFSDLLISACTGSKWACKMPPLFPPGRFVDLCAMHVGQICLT